MKNLFLIVISALLLFSCDEKQSAPPPDLLSEERFADFLVDVRMLEGAYAARYNRVDSSKYKINTYYERLLVDHGISTEQYISTYKYYMSQPKTMLAIEDRVLNKITVMVVAQDSLNRINQVNLIDSVATDTVRIDTSKKTPLLQIKKGSEK